MKRKLSMVGLGGLAVVLGAGFLMVQTARADELPDSGPFAVLAAWIAQLEAEIDALDAPTTCNSNADCATDEFCYRGVGLCGTPGECKLRPTACAALFDDVCGCDATTYVNPCFAAKNGGTSLWTTTPCP